MLVMIVIKLIIKSHKSMTYKKSQKFMIISIINQLSIQSSFDIGKLNTLNIILSALSPYRSQSKSFYHLSLESHDENNHRQQRYSDPCSQVSPFDPVQRYELV